MPLEGCPGGIPTGRGSQHRSTVVFLSTMPEAVPIVGYQPCVTSDTRKDCPWRADIGTRLSNGRLSMTLGITMISKRNMHTTNDLLHRDEDSELGHIMVICRCATKGHACWQRKK